MEDEQFRNYLLQKMDTMNTQLDLIARALAIIANRERE